MEDSGRGFTASAGRRRFAAMSGYAVAARVETRGPRFIGGASGGETPERVPDAADTPADLITPRDEPGLDVRWDAFRERWSQLTFFLFDGNSWRT